MNLSAVSIIIASYLLGCIATGYYLIRLRTGQDLRQLGSGSTGARNVSRTLGKTGFAITLLGDALKGAVAVGLARYLDLSMWGVALALLAVVAGHIFPIQLGFDGGKGLATATGALLALDYQLTIVLMILVGLSVAISRQATLCMMAFTAAAPFIALLMGHSAPTIFGIAAITLLIIWSHRTNIISAIEKLKQR